MLLVKRRRQTPGIRMRNLTTRNCLVEEKIRFRTIAILRLQNKLNLMVQPNNQHLFRCPLLNFIIEKACMVMAPIEIRFQKHNKRS